MRSKSKAKGHHTTTNRQPDGELVAWCIISARDRRQAKQNSLLQPSEASSPANTNLASGLLARQPARHKEQIPLFAKGPWLV